MRFGIVLLFCFSLILSVSAQSSWEKAEEKDGITIWLKDAPGTSIKSFRAEMILNARVSSAVAVLHDHAKHPEWMYNVTSCTRISKKSEQDRTLHYVMDLPWPIGDRDMVDRVQTVQDANTGIVTYTLTSTPKALKETDDCKRMKISDGFWEIVPLGNGKIKVHYEHTSDPEDLPAWVVNMFIVEGPRETFKSFREQIKKEKYRNAQIPWIQE